MTRTTLLACLLLGSGAAFAQSTANTVQRDINQQQRIEQGLQNGALSTKEASTLEREESRVDRMQTNALKDGKLTQSGGSAVAIDFSPDQRLMFVINQNNSEVDVIDRQSGQKVTSFGRPGSFAGQFNQPHGIAVDSKGNVYIAENRGKRIHKFRPVT